MSSEFTDRILKKYGKGILVGGNAILDEEIAIIPISPSLDNLLGGGVQEGSWMNLSSKPGVGKTTTALQLAANAQKPEYGSREVFYIDVEGRLKKRNLRGIKGLNTDPSIFHVIRSTEEKILSAQDFLTISEEILKSHKKIILIIDSYSMFCHETELLGGIGTSTRGAGGYQLLAGFCRQMSQVVPVMKNVVVGIVQMMANPTGYGSAMQEKGGNSIMYQADTWIRAKAMKPWEVQDKQIGQIVTWSTVKTSLEGSFVGSETESYLRYGIGIDSLREIIQFACDIGLINKPEKGAWYTCEYMAQHLDILGVPEWNDETKKKAKFQGEDKLYRHLQANDKWYLALHADIRNIMIGKK